MPKLLSALFSFSCFFALGQPIIQQIAPGAAPPGTQVTITGQGFHASKDSNVVFFGAVKAQLVSSSATLIVAVVPFGATHDFVTVTTQGRTAYSKAMFLPNGGGGETIGARVFNGKQDFNVGNMTYSLANADLDGNGYGDIINIVNTDKGFVRIFKNTSTLGSINLQSLDLPLSSQGLQIAIGDVNSDGNPDIIASLNNFDKPSIAVFLNNSTPGNFSFSTEKTIYTPYLQSGMVVDDLDRDGKPDIIACNYQVDKISILRNISDNEGLSFDTSISYDAGDYPASVQVADFNGNGTHEIIVINFNSDNISIFENLSGPGIIQLNEKVDFTASAAPNSISIGDLNGDGKTDFASGNEGNAFSVFINTSNGGGFSFNRRDIPWGLAPRGVGIDDLDGDSKPDLVVSGSDNFLTVHQNNGTDGSLTFRDSVRYYVNNSSGSLTIADLDNSGQPDIILGCPDRISIHLNRLLQPEIHSFSPVSGSFDSVITVFGKHFKGATSVTVGQFLQKAFTVVNDSTMQVTLGIGSTGRIQVFNPYGGSASITNFTYVRIPPVVYSVFPKDANAGELVTIKGKNFDADPKKNIVKFGMAVAQVISASDTMLLVSVPANAMYGYITVTRNATSNTGYSPNYFIPTFSGSPGSFPSNSFEHVLDSTTGAGPVSVAAGDFNMDGANDVGIVNTTAGMFSLYRNKKAENSAIGFRAGILTNLGAGVQGISLTDIFGLGAVDFMVATKSGGDIWLLHESSFIIDRYVATKFAFASKPFLVKCGDLNSNGTIDMAAISKSPVQTAINGKIQFIKNETAGALGIFSYNNPILTTSIAPTDFLMEDFDGDGKPDIMVSDSLTGLSVFRNISTLDFAFAAKAALTGNTNIQAIAAMDIDKDGKMDIVAVGLYNNVRVYRNVSTVGNISFTVHETNIPSAGYKLSIADIDGDGHADVSVYNGNLPQVLLLRNSGQFPALFSSSLQFTTKHPVTDLQFADLDGDSKPEMITVDFTSNKFSVYKNQVGGPANFYLCSGKSGTLTGDISGTNYQWQVNTDSSGFQNISDTSLYGGINSQTLTLKQTSGSWYGYRYRLLADGKQGSEYVLKFRNQWTGSAGNSWNDPANWNCATVPDANTDVIIESGTVQIDSAIVIRSLKASPGVQITVSTGGSLTILK